MIDKTQIEDEIKELEKQRKTELENSSCKYFKFARNKALAKYNELGLRTFMGVIRTVIEGLSMSR